MCAELNSAIPTERKDVPRPDTCSASHATGCLVPSYDRGTSTRLAGTTFSKKETELPLSNGKTLTVFLPYDVYKEGFFSTAFHIRCLIHLQAQQQHLADKLCAIHSKSISNEIVSGLLEKHSNSEMNMLLESVRPNLPSRTDENPLPSQLPATPRPRPQAPGAGTWQQLWLRRAPAATWRLLPPRGAGGPHCPFINNRRSPS